MNFIPKLVALDVDGTLVNRENQMSDPVREAVLAIAGAGIETVIATGRSMPGVLDTVGKLGFDKGLSVASNGAVVFEYNPVNVLRNITFDASEAVAMILEKVPDAMVAVEEVGRGYRVNQPFPDSDINGKITVQSIDDLIAEPVSRVIISAPRHSAEEFSAIVHDLGLTGTNYFIGYTAWVDLAPEGESKASGLEYVCSRLGIDRHDVLAVGDGNNDYEMLEWAGRGVAMGHAPQRILDVADAVTGTIDEDGLATELQRYL